jgi:hypothetical protein
MFPAGMPIKPANARLIGHRIDRNSDTNASMGFAGLGGPMRGPNSAFWLAALLCAKLSFV